MLKHVVNVLIPWITKLAEIIVFERHYGGSQAEHSKNSREFYACLSKTHDEEEFRNSQTYRLPIVKHRQTKKQPHALLTQGVVRLHIIANQTLSRPKNDQIAENDWF